VSVDLDDLSRSVLQQLQVAATPWRVRGSRQGELLIDTTDARIAWEPRRVTPVYAVPEAAFRAPLGPPASPRPLTDAERRRPVLDPGVPFAAHTAEGVVRLLEAVAGPPVETFTIDDPVLGGRVLVDFQALEWREEEHAVVAHPRDPYHRIDVRPTTRHVVLSAGGVVLADSTRARMLFETRLPLRWYLPREDVRVPLEPGDLRTACAYKGRATHYHARVGGEVLRDIAWSYEQPLSDGRDVQGLVAFYAERLDLTVDGVPQPRRGLGDPARQPGRLSRSRGTGSSSPP
jgi:uncharacterized protein (DUF427 family)